VRSFRGSGRRNQHCGHPSSKLGIATAQLDTAIALYLEGKHLISLITLAGAAEEILGKLAEKSVTKSAFNEILDRLCAMHEAM
jgi:hypothetical protein